MAYSLFCPQDCFILVRVPVVIVSNGTGMKQEHCFVRNFRNMRFTLNCVDWKCQKPLLTHISPSQRERQQYGRKELNCLLRISASLFKRP